MKEIFKHSKSNTPRRTAKPPKSPGRPSAASDSKIPRSGGNSRFTPEANGKR